MAATPRSAIARGGSCKGLSTKLSVSLSDISANSRRQCDDFILCSRKLAQLAQLADLRRECFQAVEPDAQDREALKPTDGARQRAQLISTYIQKF